MEAISAACVSIPGSLHNAMVPCTTAGSEEAIRDKLMKDNRESSSKVTISEERKQDRAQLISEQVILSVLA